MQFRFLGWEDLLKEDMATQFGMPRSRASFIAQSVNNLPAMQETQVYFLGWEDSLEKEMTTHSSIPSLRNPLDRGAWLATVYGIIKSRTLLSV